MNYVVVRACQILRDSDLSQVSSPSQADPGWFSPNKSRLSHADASFLKTQSIPHMLLASQ